jgi:heme exporter protein D
MYFDSVAAALAMDGHGAYVWSAYALSLLVLVYVVSAPLRRQRRLLRELRGEARRNADRSLRNDVELN